ncbi:Polycystic kidney disease and receptor for egg jelly-related protein [Manis javanica]|nr:Polycystic kidney disease and receptor for egg jelly-related protein [Manis javanica]
MRPRPAPLVLLMLLLGLGPGLGRPPPPPAPRRALTAPRSAGSRSPRTPGRTAVPSHVDLRLRAPRGRRALRWLAPLPLPRWLRRPEGALRPGPASPVPPRSDLPGGASHGPSGTECPTDQPPPGVGDADNSSKPHAIESSVSRLLPADAPCDIHQLKINRDEEGAPLLLTRKMEATLSATVRYVCASAQNLAEQWEVFSVPSIFDQPDWTKPLQVRGLRLGKSIREMYIPKNSLSLGVYVFNFSLTILTVNPERPLVKGSDNIYVVVIKSPLNAVILGPSSTAVNFTDELILNGTTSSDPEADDPLEGLQFFWYCTTNPGNYQGDKILGAEEVCLPEQADLAWTWASGPVLTLLPETLKVSWQLATVRTWQADQALQQYTQKDKYVSSEQIETVSTGTLTSLSNILKLPSRHHVADEPFHVLESLADTILSGKVPGNETTVMTSASVNMYIKRTEKWDVTTSSSDEKHSRNCFHPTLNVSSVPSLPESAPVSMMFCEFADDPFPWLSYPENRWAEVVGFRMTGTTANGDVVEITPDVAEVYLVRKNLSFAAFNLTVGPDDEPSKDDGSLKMTTGRFLFEVDSRAVREVLAHIVTEVTVLFTVLVYAGREVTPMALVATFLVPHDIPPVANQSGLFDPACTVKQARVVCLPPSLLQVVAQRGRTSESVITMVLQAPRFVMKPSDKIVRISLFSVHCLDMYGIQSDWREDTCVLGEKTTWRRVHCICKSPGRARRQLDTIKLASLRLRTRYLTARVIVVPNPVDLSISSFFIVFYGLTYGYEKSIEWLFASFCSCCQSVFLEQPSKILLLSGFRTTKTKYCKNLSWVTKYRYTKIKLHSTQLSPDEMRRLHQCILQVRGSRMYQPLTEDELRIFQRKKRLKKRALLFLSCILTHFTFLALLWTLVALLHHTDSFHYNQFIRSQFSMELGTVTKVKDIYSWLHSVVLPLFHNDLNPTFLPGSSSTILGLPLMRQALRSPVEGSESSWRARSSQVSGQRRACLGRCGPAAPTGAEVRPAALPRAAQTRSGGVGGGARGGAAHAPCSEGAQRPRPRLVARRGARLAAAASWGLLALGLRAAAAALGQDGGRGQGRSGEGRQLGLSPSRAGQAPREPQGPHGNAEIKHRRGLHMACEAGCRPLGVFECQLCALTAPYSYVGQKPPNTQSIVLLEESYVMKDPFTPDKDRFLILGSRCTLCSRLVCVGPECSLFYSKRFCLPCVQENIDAFPQEIRQDLEKRKVPSKRPSSQPGSRT